MKRDLAAQIKVGFEKAFSIKGTAVSELFCTVIPSVWVGVTGVWCFDGCCFRVEPRMSFMKLALFLML